MTTAPAVHQIGLCVSAEVGKVRHHLSQEVAYLTAGYILTFGEQYFTVNLQVQSADQSHEHKAKMRDLYVPGMLIKFLEKEKGYLGFLSGFYNWPHLCTGS